MKPPMSDNEIRVAIAEAAGARYHWTADRRCIFLTLNLHDGDVVGEDEHLKILTLTKHIGHDIPDYPNDLNAMAEAEQTLTGSKDDEDSEIVRYGNELVFVCGGKQDPPDVYEIDLIRAKARQRAEAFLKAKNLWKP